MSAFVSLVEGALRERAPAWRELELRLELAGKLKHQSGKGRKKRRGEGGQPMAGAVVARILALREEGRSFTSIAQETGLSRNAVTRALCRRLERMP